MRFTFLNTLRCSAINETKSSDDSSRPLIVKMAFDLQFLYFIFLQNLASKQHTNEYRAVLVRAVNHIRLLHLLNVVAQEIANLMNIVAVFGLFF